jgi:hypothetical protein
MTTKTKKTEDGGVQVRRIRAGGFWCWLHRMETPGLACYNLANISSISHDIQSPQWRRHCIGVAWDTMGYFGTSWDQSITIYWDIMTEWGYVILCHQNDLGLSWNMGHTHTHAHQFMAIKTRGNAWDEMGYLICWTTWHGSFLLEISININIYIYIYVYRYVLTYHDRNRADEVCSDMNRP